MKTTDQIANQLVSLCRDGRAIEAYDFYASSIESVEMPFSPNAIVKGLESVRNKAKKWYDTIETVHRRTVSDPVVVGNHFSVVMDYELTHKTHGRMSMEEICVYQVFEGKIIREQFFYSM